MVLSLAPFDTLQLAPDDFGAQLFGDTLLLPRELYEFLKDWNIHNAEGFLSVAHAFPSSFAAKFGWTQEGMVKAREKLVATLEGRVPEDFLRPPPRVRRAYGARDPAELDSLLKAKREREGKD